jgi:hypothetical protein
VVMAVNCSQYFEEGKLKKYFSLFLNLHLPVLFVRGVLFVKYIGN